MNCALALFGLISRAEKNVPEGYTVSYSPNPTSVKFDSNTNEYALTITNKHVPKEVPDDDEDDDGNIAGTDKDDAKGAKTGDETNVGIWIGLLLAAVIAAAIVIIRRRRKEE